MGTDHTTASVTSYEGYADEDYVLFRKRFSTDMQLFYPVGGETLQDQRHHSMVCP